MPPTRTPQRPNQQRPVALPPIPFTAAAHEHTEPVITDSTLALGAAQQPRGPFDVPAYGFLRHVFLEVTGSGGTLGAGVLSADYPFNILQNIALIDVNGAPIFGPLDGFAALQANIYGAYAFRSDPRLAPDYVGTINCKFGLRIPIEITRHNAYGSLANQNAAAAYKLSWTLNTSTAAYSTAPTTPASVQVKAWLESWSQPNATDLTGRPQMREPIGHGTTQFWSAFTKAGLAIGNQTILLPRVGNLVRGLIFIARDGTGARSDGVLPDPLQVTWDARILRYESQFYRRSRQAEGLLNGIARDTGVFSIMFNDINDGNAGDEDPNLWLPTVQATRLEVDGTNTVAGSLQIVTNDVAPVEVRPDERFVETSATGFHPNVATPVTS
jgi:hypothetical protein